MKKTIKRNVKDSVFTHLFQEPKYIVELYKALHPEDTEISEESIEIVTLENVLSDGIYNDLGFLVNNKLIVLAEAQSTWSENIIIRGLMYLVQTYQDYISQEELNVYGTRKVKLPKPELYVIYTGEKQIDRDVIHLSEEFFDGDASTIEVSVKVICNSVDGDIINQYIQFSKIYTEQLKIYGDPRKAIVETIRICKDKNILKEYLESKESEVEDIMFMLYDDAEINRIALRDAEKRGKSEGLEQGLEQGEKSATRKIVFRMLRNNKTDDDIIADVDISSEELNKLKSEYASA